MPDPEHPLEKSATFTTTVQQIRDADALFQASKYNDPLQTAEIPLMTAIGEANTGFEANLLTYKIIAVSELMRRKLLPTQEEGGRASFGIRIPYEGYHFCVDTMIDLPDQTALLVRCLGTTEKLHREEWGFWEAMSQHQNVRKIFFVANAELHPLDEALIARIAEQTNTLELLRIRAEDLKD